MKWTAPQAGMTSAAKKEEKGAHRLLSASDENPIVDLVNYGDLMMMVNTDKRWVYKGSVTTPPCGQSVYWNVVSTVYPIKQAHLDLFKAQLGRGENNLAETGNWRVTGPVDEHNVIYISGEKSSSATMILALLLIILVIINVVVIICFMMKRMSAHKSIS